LFEPLVDLAYLLAATPGAAGAQNGGGQHDTFIVSPSLLTTKVGSQKGRAGMANRLDIPFELAPPSCLSHAVAVQAGTRFLRADEAVTVAVHRATPSSAAFTTAVTKAFRGRYAWPVERLHWAARLRGAFGYPEIHHLTPSCGPPQRGRRYAPDYPLGGHRI
jgi:hypothetical protein